MTTTKTKHSTNCHRAWSHYDATCPRCRELSVGAPARKGWGFRRQENERRFLADLKAHDCVKAGCGPVCTFGDW